MLSISKVSILQQEAALATAWLFPSLLLSWCPGQVHLLLLRGQVTLIPAVMRAEHTWGSLLKSGGNEGSLFAQITAKTCLTLVYFSSKL